MAMFKTHKELPPDEQAALPPALLTRDVQNKTGLMTDTSSEIQQELTMLSHYGYGALGGIIYAALASKSSAHPIIKGSAFGLGVWGASYYGLIPGLDLNPSGKTLSNKRNLMMIAAHIAWGASLGFAEHELRTLGNTLLNGKNGTDNLH
jgi:uncharacterized membrane protein YagU involved in acid resistance